MLKMSRSPSKAQEMHDELKTELIDVFSKWDAKEGDLSAVEGILAKLKYTTNLIQGH